MELSSCTPTAASPCNFTCCSLGPLTSERVYYGQPVMPFNTESILQVVFVAVILFGGLINVISPALTKPKGVLAPFFFKRLGTGLFLRATPSEALGVMCVIGIYSSRFVGYYRLYAPYEVSLEPGFPGSNGHARAVAQALEQVWYVGLPLQITLGVKNVGSPWWWLAGLPQERALSYHNFNGYFLCLALITAWICYAIGGLTTRHLTSPFCFCDINPLAGLIALGAQCILTLMSLPFVRRKHWEYFYLMGHFQLIFPMLWGMFFNDRIAIFPWYVISFATWGWSDLPMRAYMKVGQPARVLSAAVTNGTVTRLTMTKKRADGSGKTLGLMTSQWEAGSYVWIAVRMPNANPLKGQAPPPFSADWACYHAMTISSPPIDAKGEPAQEFTIHVKSMGPGTWSQALVEKVEALTKEGVSPDQLMVWVGGPNGSLSISPYDCDRVVLVGGGIGVTPMMALAQELKIRGKLEGAEAPTPEVDFVYIERHLDNFSAFDAALGELTAAPGASAPPFRTQLYCTQPGTHGGDATDPFVHGLKVAAGRPKFAEILADAATLKAEQVQVDVTGSKGSKKLVVGVFSCGPPKMMADVRAAVQGASSGAASYYLHEETFEL